MNNKTRRAPLHLAFSNRDRVLEEIACIENRLAEIGPDGDCAYENAMIRIFESQVELRRAWLDNNLGKAS